MRFLSLALVALAAATAAPALASDVSYQLNNSSDLTVMYFYTSPTSQPTWSEDVLGSQVLAPGESATVTIFDGTANCDYDIKFVMEDQQEVIDQVNICDMASYTLENAG